MWSNSITSWSDSSKLGSFCPLLVLPESLGSSPVVLLLLPGEQFAIGEAGSESTPDEEETIEREDWKRGDKSREFFSLGPWPKLTSFGTSSASSNTWQERQVQAKKQMTVRP